MKKFALPQQKETSVNNLTKMSELFKKYNLCQIGKLYQFDDTIKELIVEFVKNPPKVYSKQLGALMFLYEFLANIGSRPDDLKKVVQGIFNDNRFREPYEILVFKSDEYKLLKEQAEREEIQKQLAAKGDSVEDSNFPWDERITKFIYENFLDTTKPTVAPTVTHGVISSIPGLVPSIWHPEFFDRVEAVVKGGLSYFDTFLSGLAPMLGDKQSYHLYKYQYKVIDRSVTSLEEFVRKNSHLGRNFFVEVMPLLMSEEQIRMKEIAKQEKMNEELIGADPNIFPSLKIPKLVEDEAYLLELVNNNFVRGGSTTQGVDHDYVYGVLDEATFWGIGEPAVMGAIKDARDEINALPGCESFTLKELMMSPVVATKFQLYVSYLMQRGSGGYAYAGRAYVSKFGKVNGTTFNVSAGTKQRNLLALNMEGCQYWFQDVKKIKNPRIEELENFIQAVNQEREKIIGKDIGFNDAQKKYATFLLIKMAKENPDYFVEKYFGKDTAAQSTFLSEEDHRKLKLQFVCENMKLSKLINGKNEGKISIENENDGTVLLLDTRPGSNFFNYLDLSIHWRIATNQLKFMPKNILVHYE